MSIEKRITNAILSIKKHNLPVGNVYLGREEEFALKYESNRLRAYYSGGMVLGFPFFIVNAKNHLSVSVDYEKLQLRSGAKSRNEP